MTKTQEQLRQEGLRAARNMVRKFKAREERKGNNTMTLARFINYINYSTVCPTGINPVRWTAMISSAKKNGFFPKKA